MSELLLNNQLRASTNSQDEKRYIARVRALAVLNRLDAKRKRILLQFLKESVLIHAESEFGCIIQLEGADFSNADLSHLLLDNVELIGANLSHARLNGANLSHAIIASCVITQEQMDSVRVKPTETV